MDKTTTSNETAIIELEMLTPLFIKGKDPDYGEGMYFFPNENKAYLLDNDKLCKFIYDKTYDKDGKILVDGKDYVALYSELLANEGGEKEIAGLYDKFSRFPGSKIDSSLDDIPKQDKERLKGKSIQYFLDNLDLLEKNKKSEIERLSKGVTTLHLSNKNKKFIQNGCGERFLPGSSIKGAIRNALLWKMINADMGLKLKFAKFAYEKFQWCEEWAKTEQSKKREFATGFSRKDNDAPTPLAKASLDSITMAAFSPEFAGNKALVTPEYIKGYNKHWKKASDIHRDLSRIIKVTDANFIERAKWKKIDIATYNLRGERFQKRDKTDADLEAADKTTKAWFRITLNLDLAREYFGNSIPTYLQSIENILKTVSEFFYAVANEELDFYGKATHVGTVHSVKQWYEELLRSAEIEGQEEAQLFRLGWGGGMMTKTQFLHLDEKDRKRSRDLMNPRDETVAPQSRCLQVSENEALRPLGWCTLRYLGRDIADAKDALVKAEAKRQATEPAPPGCVRATIVDDKSSPIKIRIEEGEYKDSVIEMTGMKQQQLQNLGLQKNSVVFVALVEQRKKKGKGLTSANYRRKL